MQSSVFDDEPGFGDEGLSKTQGFARKQTGFNRGNTGRLLVVENLENHEMKSHASEESVEE